MTNTTKRVSLNVHLLIDEEAWADDYLISVEEVRADVQNMLRDVVGTWLEQRELGTLAPQKAHG